MGRAGAASREKEINLNLSNTELKTNIETILAKKFELKNIKNFDAVYGDLCEACDLCAPFAGNALQPQDIEYSLGAVDTVLDKYFRIKFEKDKLFSILDAFVSA
jgi:hypothetical protein